MLVPLGSWVWEGALQLDRGTVGQEGPLDTRSMEGTMG